MTVISTATTDSITLVNSFDMLAVLASGSIVNYAGDIDGTASLGNTVTIAGYVELYGIWLAGQNTVSIAASGIYVGHGTGSSLIIGQNASNVYTGGSVLNNAGLITAEANSVLMGGGNNLINNSGTISADNVAVTFHQGTNSQLVNTGTITARLNGAVQMFEGYDSTINSGTISSGSGSAILGIGEHQNVQNTGILSSGQFSVSYAVHLQGAGSTLLNDGVIVGSATGAVAYQGLDGTITNTGRIRSAGDAVYALGFSGVITNSGDIISRNNEAIEIIAPSPTAITSILNSGIITGAIDAILGGSATEVVINSGTINGNVQLGAGDDRFDGRGGVVNGYVAGGTGSDSYHLDDASLTIVELAEDTGTDIVFASVNCKLADNVENLTLLGANDLNGTGNAGNNTMTGNAGDNRLSGLTGNDTITAGSGEDRAVGGGGNDSLSGGDGDDILRGGDGNDTLTGGDGDDLLLSGNGRDSLTGGGGGDAFIFTVLAHSNKASASADVITDFTMGEDRIDLSALDAKSTNGNPDDAFTFIGSGAFTNVAGQLNFTIDVPNNATYVRLDVDGDGAADSTIRLTGQITLHAGDFLL